MTQLFKESILTMQDIGVYKLRKDQFITYIFRAKRYQSMKLKVREFGFLKQKLEL